MRSQGISSFLQDRIDADDFPSAVYLIAENGQIVFQDALGFAVAEPKPMPATLDTIYDLASLTKPLVTGLLTTIMIERGLLDPNETIGNLLPEFYTSSNSEITVNHLLMHTSGLPAWRPFYLLVDSPEEITTEIARTLGTGDQEPVTYSDLNFIILAALIERISGTDLSDLADQAIIDLLGLTVTSFRPLKKFSRDQIAASEKGNAYERQTCVDLGYLPEDEADASSAIHFRDELIWGEVHDGNAWFMGGSAGHAGLFSTAEEVFRIALQFLPEHTRLLKPETTELFRTNFTQGLNEDRAVAFQLASTGASTAGSLMSPQSFGHNGFTGTSLWIDPLADRIFVLLTNRTHNHALPFVNINSVRRRFHDLAVDELTKNS